jgi:chemotaxis response regulator CheB
MRVERSPAENLSRPSVDVLFRSAAMSYGRRVIGVLLSGMLSDGTAGMWQIWKHGGITIVQDPSEASYGDMPNNALANVPVDYSLRLAEIAKKLVALTKEQPSAPPITGPRSARVFIVEDERLVAMNLGNRLSALGYEVVGSVSSGEEALQKVPASPPDVVLMDICLEGNMSGIEAARRLWERYQIPVVYLTAYADEETLDAVKTSNPYGYIVKPYRLEQIHVALQLALDRYEREVLIDRMPALKRSHGKQMDT